MLADGTETHMPVTRKGHVGMDFVGYYIHIVSIADFGHTLQHLFAPHSASWIVRIAQYQPLTLMGTPFQIFKIYCKTSVDYLQRTAHQPAATILGQIEEGGIYRCGDHNPVAGLRHGLQHKRDSCHNARDEMQLLSLAIQAVMVLQPVTYRLPIAVLRPGIAQHLVLATVAQSVHYEIGRAEIHVRHPHRHQVVSPEKLFQGIVFHTSRTLARDDFVEKILFH